MRETDCRYMLRLRNDVTGRGKGSVVVYKWVWAISNVITSFIARWSYIIGMEAGGD